MHAAQDNDLAISIIQNNDVTPDLDRELRGALVECYPEDRDFFSRCRSWHSEPEWIVCAFTPDGTVAALTAVIGRTVTVGRDAIPVTIAGLQSVFVRTAWRKTRLSERIMDAVLDEAGNRNLDAGLLFCLPVLCEKVYGRMGWRKLAANVYMADTSGAVVPLPEKNIAMTYLLALKEFPEGDIDLQGSDW